MWFCMLSSVTQTVLSFDILGRELNVCDRATNTKNEMQSGKMTGWSGAGVQGWESVSRGDFQETCFPRCTIIFQDLKDSKLLIFQDPLRFQRWIFQNVVRFQESSNIVHKESKNVQTYFRFNGIYSGVKIIQNHSETPYKLLCRKSEIIIFMNS